MGHWACAAGMVVTAIIPMQKARVFSKWPPLRVKSRNSTISVTAGTRHDKSGASTGFVVSGHRTAISEGLRPSRSSSGPGVQDDSLDSLFCMPRHAGSTFAAHLDFNEPVKAELVLRNKDSFLYVEFRLSIFTGQRKVFLYCLYCM